MLVFFLLGMKVICIESFSENRTQNLSTFKIKSDFEAKTHEKGLNATIKDTLLTSIR